MSNVDMSLDEIIQRNRGSRLRMPKFKRGFMSKGSKVAERPSNFDLKNKLHNRQFPDARLKIIGLQRAQMKDARDRLNVIAKQTDARQRLLKLKATRMNKQLLQPAGLKAKPSLSVPTLTRTVNNVSSWKDKGQQNRDLFGNRIFQQASKFVAPVNHPHKITGGLVRNRLGFKNITERSHSINFGIDPTRVNDDRIFSNSRRLTVTTANAATKQKISDDDEEDLHLLAPDHQSFSKRIKNDSMSSELSSFAASRLNVGLKNRLSPLECSITTPGFKVMVSNLHANVSQDDIQELFAEIGPLHRALLNRRGVAEVVFCELSHALKACEVYHNRQLDGRPMCVKLVTTSNATQRFPSLNNDHPENSSRSQIKISPDIEIIRQALFHKGITSSTASQQPFFTITMAKQ